MNFLTDLVKDVRYAIRSLQRTPGFTLVVILSLALGIGANTAIFSGIEALILRRLPVPNPEELVALEWGTKAFPQRLVEDFEGNGGRSTGGDSGAVLGARIFSSSVYEYLREHNDVFSSLFAVSGNILNVNIGLKGGAEPAD